jgi:hypothetical protein
MKKWILLTAIALSTLFTATAQNFPRESWTYNSLTAGPLSSAPSLITGSAFGTGAESYLTVLNTGLAQFNGSTTANLSYSEGLSATDYAGKTSGIYQISYKIIGAGFF